MKVLLAVAILSATFVGADEDWSDLHRSNDSTLNWRWRGNTYGSMTPDCDVEFENYAGPAIVEYRVTYDTRNIYDTRTENRAILVTTPSGSDNINNCSAVRGLTVVAVRR